MAMATMCPCPSQHHWLPTVNVHYYVVINSLLLLYLIRRQMHMQKTRVQQFVFMFTTMYHILLLMEHTHMNNKQHVLCVPLILVL